MKKHSGFTLIELSIVLVIVGLIVGAVIIGKEMIETAKIRAQLSQIEQVNTSINTFKGKYNCYPGDCATAVSFGLGTNTSWHNGNGDQKLDYGCFMNNIPLSKESFNFYSQLSLAGLIQGTFGAYTGQAYATGWDDSLAKTNFLLGKLNGTVLIPTGFDNTDVRCPNPAWAASELRYIRTGGRGYALAGIPVGPNYYTQNYPVPVLTVFAMDAKIDDGMPLTGKIGVSQYYDITTIAAAAIPDWGAGGGCVTGTNSYSSATAATTKCTPVFLFQY